MAQAEDLGTIRRIDSNFDHLGKRACEALKGTFKFLEGDGLTLAEGESADNEVRFSMFGHPAYIAFRHDFEHGYLVFGAVVSGRTSTRPARFRPPPRSRLSIPRLPAP